MSWTRIQGGQAQGAGATTSLTLPATIANGSIVCGSIWMYPAATNTITSIKDDKGNNYIQVTSVSGSVGGNNTIIVPFWSAGHITNSPKIITVTTTGNFSFLWVIADEFTPPAGTLAVDGHGTGAGSSGSIATTSWMTVNNSALIYGCGATNSANLTAGSGFTLTEGSGVYDTNEFMVQSTAGLISATFGGGPNDNFITAGFSVSATSTSSVTITMVVTDIVGSSATATTIATIT